jgi:hypothetical protein
MQNFTLRSLKHGMRVLKTRESQGFASNGMDLNPIKKYGNYKYLLSTRINMKKISKTKNDKSIFSEIDLNKMFSANRILQPFQMFYEVNKVVCNRITFYNSKPANLLPALLKKYEKNESALISSRVYSQKKAEYCYTSFLLPITKDIWVFHGGGEHEQEGTTILYATETQNLRDLQDLIMSFEEVPVNDGKIYLLHKFDYGFDLKAYDVKETTCDIKKHYNDDFEEMDAKIINRLNTTNDRGLVLLHGKPGTGKTSYIRYLTKKVNKKMIFLSPEVSQQISSPEFITILSEYPNSIIIIEDAENVIKTRKSGGSSAISNLLNLTDGLLADCLKIQLICSFNTDVSQIDKALLRKGRLIAMYEFNELKQQKAHNLSMSLGQGLPIDTDTTLADIFNVDETGAQTEVFAKIGY